MESLDYNNPDQTYLHCKHCLDEFWGNPTHRTMSPAQFMDYQASGYPYEFEKGRIAMIVVVWCKHCRRSVWDSRHLVPKQ